MKLLLDTTYLLPAIGISVKNVRRDLPIKLIKKGYSLFISEVTIFELSAKGSKHVASGNLAPERVLRGIRAIVHDDRIVKVPVHDESILLTSFKLRRILDDYIDCLILSSAINRCDILLTEDKRMRGLKRKVEFQEILKEVNPKFSVASAHELT